MRKMDIIVLIGIVVALVFYTMDMLMQRDNIKLCEKAFKKEFNVSNVDVGCEIAKRYCSNVQVPIETPILPFK